MGNKITVDVSDETKDQMQDVPTKNSTLPSVHGAKINAFRTCERKNLTIQQIPIIIMEEFENLAKSNGLTKKQYFYEMLRQAGVDIPPYNEIHKSGGF